MNVNEYCKTGLNLSNVLKLFRSRLLTFNFLFYSCFINYSEVCKTYKCFRILTKGMWCYSLNWFALFVLYSDTLRSVVVHPESKKDSLLMLIFSWNINRFSKFVTARLGTKFATKWSLQIPPHRKDIAALPCETIMFQLLVSSAANTLLKRNVKFGQCFQFSSLSSAVYQSRLSCSFS